MGEGMDISRIQVNQALREERPGSTEGVTGKVLSRQNNTLEILVGDNVVKVEARAAGKIVPGDVVQVFFGEDTLRTARLGQERPNPVTAKLIDVFSLSFPFPLDENTTRIVEGFSDSEKIGFSRLVSEINRIVGSLLQETLAQGALETAEGTRDSFFFSQYRRAEVLYRGARTARQKYGKGLARITAENKRRDRESGVDRSFIKKSGVENRRRHRPLDSR